ncbi:succinylglutamate desuccinylase [Niveibacterium umoris]|uniref:Succinylglutamate desuccinylase n=1 Tax=Niveibacterium umoris TaxID=1193620 RepID=A0A840BHN3_9RHOO|nr:succinylglutamate desuccinylase [Niveibacterium umoris]MBB4012153.1 succinylglutamate desuccinylase [Niveibacterium umoris]
MGLLSALLAGDEADLPPSLPCGATVEKLAAGVWMIAPAQLGGRPLVISAGIHGDETAPVEVLCELADALVRGELCVRVPLLLAFGNLAALRAGRRYLDDDLNRLFAGATGAPGSRERPRAQALLAARAAFADRFGAALHLDLHSAIRASIYECFAVAPSRGACLTPELHALLAACGIEAVMLAGDAAPTFSALSVRAHGGEAFTFELGRVRKLGEGAATEFEATAACLRALVSAAPLPPARATPITFRVSREIIKASDAFRLNLPPDAPNFTGFAPGALIAEDGDARWMAGAGERIVFPNPGVKPGLRAGVLVVADSASDS